MSLTYNSSASHRPRTSPHSRRRAGRATTALIATAVAGSLVLAGCGSPSGGDKPNPGVLNLTGQLTSNNPALDSAPDLYAISLTYSALTHVEADGSLSPDLATEWGFDPDDHTIFDFTLRDGVTFADGTEVDAEGVAAWLNYVAFEAQSPYTAGLGQIQSVEATGPMDVRITLAAPNPTLPEALSDQSPTGYVASPKCVADLDLFTDDPAVCGSGQYVLVPEKSTSGSLWTFAPNAEYYDQDKIKFTSVTVRSIETPTSAFQALQAGQLNVVTVLGADSSFSDQAKSSGFEVYAGPPTFGLALMLDAEGSVAEPLADLRVRQALNYALDRDALGAAFDPTAVATSQLVSTDGYVEANDTYYTYDPEKAKDLLAEAGYPDGFTLSNVLSTSAIPGFETVSQVLADQLSQVGVTVEYNMTSTFAEYLQAVVTSTDSPMVVSGLQTNSSMWFQYAVSIPRSNHFGGTGWKDDELEALFQSALAADTPEEASADWQGMSDRMTEQALFAPLFTTSGIMFAAKDVKGIELSLAHGLALPIEWSID